MSIKAVLFDLDGTLLPMKQEDFVNFYLPLLAETYVSEGVEIDKHEFLKAVWKGYEAMKRNDGSCTNREVFWKYMKEAVPVTLEKAEEISVEFYRGDFNKTACVATPTPLSDKVVKTVKEKGIKAYLATNPVFPRDATLNRMRWAGISTEDFEVITTYEDNRYCKPNPEYFREILERFQLNPEECLMVGNDVEEDLIIRTLGVKTYLVTDHLENSSQLPIETDFMGTMEELLQFVEALPCLE